MNIVQNKFEFIDLFAGIGGFRKGFESIGGNCVFTSEIDKFAKETYKANFQTNHLFAGDIRDVDTKSIPSHDVLLAGFPCQPFSLAGVSKKNSLGKAHGFDCKIQGTLFFEIAKIIDHHRPKAFLLENVKNLASHDKGQTFETILDVLKNQLGYKVQYRIINAKSYVPQNRQRIYIVGFREENDFNFNDLIIPEISDGPSLNSVLHPEDGSEILEDRFTFGDLAKVDKKYTITDKLWSYLKVYAEKHRAKGNGFGFGLCQREDVARTLSARYHKDGAEILIYQGEHKNPRRLTPRECARLMGFDKTGQSSFHIPVSDTQAYRQFGNSVVVPVIEEIAKAMSLYLYQRNNIFKEKITLPICA